MLLSNFIRSNINFIAKRHFRKKPALKAWPNDWVPFVWNRPVTDPGYYDTIDLEGYQEGSIGELLPEVANSKELQASHEDSPIRRIFSTQHAKQIKGVKTKAGLSLKKLGLIHELDPRNSLEARIISTTYTYRMLISNIQSVGEDNPYKNRLRTLASNLKDKRFGYLCELKELHRGRYERILKIAKLDDVDNKINVPYEFPYRKIQMRRIANEYARDLKEKKVEEFNQSLAKEKEEFVRYKEETLKWIEEKERQLGMVV